MVASVLRRSPGCRFTVVALPGHASLSSALTNAKRYLGLYGAFGFLARGAQMLLLRIAAALGTGAGRRHSLRRVALAGGAAFLSIDDMNSQSTRDLLQSLAPDVFVSIACPQILRRKTLSIPRLLALNVHSALLPRNRGMLPTFWSLMEDPPGAGVTLHVMSPKLDDGEILLQKEVPATREDTSLHQLLARCKQTAADLVVEGLDLIGKGSWSLSPNLSSHATTNKFPSAADSREFRRKGGRIW
jgi:methionyl-tRNA formyltransferase